MEVTETPKRAKSVKRSQDIVPTPKISETGWEAAFNPPTETKELIQTNGVNGYDSKSDKEGSPAALDFEEFATQERKAEKQREEKKLLKSLANSKLDTWKISSSIGGRMINVDPVFTADEQYFILATPTTINVYSTSTSLLIRSIEPRVDKFARPHARIITYCLSPTSPNLVWVAFSDGAVYCVEWTSGAGSDQYWSISSTGCIHMTVASMLSAGRRRDVVFTTESRKDGGWRITANELAPPNGPIHTVARTIYSSTQKVNFLKTAREGSVVAAASRRRILVGVLRSDEYDTIDKIRYEFRVFESTDFISSLDLKVSERQKPQNTKVAAPKRLPIVDIVVGDVKGTIFLHNDLWLNLGETTKVKHKKLAPGISLMPQKLHWHRQAVHTVKWSLDGNYIISGGTETVLVLWQLDTGKHQFLPHMGSTIQNVVVSPSGSLYGVQLADNSAMVLSVADLQPIANIAGIQSNVLNYEEPIESTVRRVTEDPYEYPLFQRTPAAISTRDPSRLFLGVGNAQEISHIKSTPTSNPFLQTFDLGTGYNVSRQALTRTNITGITAAPDAHRISEPRVTHMQLSFDGLWLATVDEWTPPKRDMNFIKHQGIDIAEERQHRREVFLKFWQWREESKSWELVSRINDPHAYEDSVGAPRILDIATDPSALRFSTIGEDGIVRTWSTKTRKRDGVVVRGKDGNALHNWNCEHAISIGKTDLDSHEKVQNLIPNGSVAFSDDGSLLAAAYGGNNQGLLHLLDPEIGSIRLSQNHMFLGDILKIEFLGQDLITLSDTIIVYDLISDEVRYSIKLSPSVTDLALSQKKEMIHLALDRKSRTFAVALPFTSSSAETETPLQQPLTSRFSELAVFHQDRREPVLREQFSTIITALLPAVGFDGYLILDSAAEIRTVTKKGAQAITTLAQSTEALRLDPSESEGELNPLEEEVEVEEDDGEEEAIPRETNSNIADDDDEDDTPVVTQQQLSAIFDIGPSFALPPLEEMFYQVAGLFASPPLTQSV